MSAPGEPESVSCECAVSDSILIPGARYVSLPGANHLMLEEEPAWSLFLEELGQFLYRG